MTMCYTYLPTEKKIDSWTGCRGMNFTVRRNSSWQSGSPDMDMWKKSYKNEGCLLVLNRWIGSPLLRTGLTKLVSAPATTTHAPQDEMDESEFIASKLLGESLKLRCSFGLQCMHPWNCVDWTCLCCPDGFSPQKRVQSAAGAANEGWTHSYRQDMIPWHPVHAWSSPCVAKSWQSKSQDVNIVLYGRNNTICWNMLKYCALVLLRIAWQSACADGSRKASLCACQHNTCTTGWEGRKWIHCQQTIEWKSETKMFFWAPMYAHVKPRKLDLPVLSWRLLGIVTRTLGGGSLWSWGILFQIKIVARNGS